MPEKKELVKPIVGKASGKDKKIHFGVWLKPVVTQISALRAKTPLSP